MMENLVFLGQSQKNVRERVAVSNTFTRVLLIEDNPGDIRIIREMLEKESKLPFELVCSNILSQGLKRMQKGDINVILLDLSLPDSDGLEGLSKVLSHAPGVPIIVFTGTEDDLIFKDAMKKGASGYLVKGSVNSEALVKAVQNVI